MFFFVCKVGVRPHLKQWRSAPIFPIAGLDGSVGERFSYGHAGLLGIAASCYSYAKLHAVSSQHSLGTGKVVDFGSFASALIFGVVAIAIESVERFAQEIREIIEQSGDTKITDLPVWQVGPKPVRPLSAWSATRP